MLRAELDAIVAASQDANLDDEHDPEGATVAFERQRTASLLAAAEARLADLDAAAGRLAAGAYGLCEVCGGPIGDERLAALPATQRCVACAGGADPGRMPDWRAELVGGLRARLAPRGSPGSRIVAIDGWSGSGKTSLAAWLAPALGAPCVAAEDLVAGWHGLAESVGLLVRGVLEPLAGGRPARWQAWDWSAGAWGVRRGVEPEPIVVVEGCGAGSAAARPWLAALVWLDVEPAPRASRLRAREDWALYEPWAGVWADQEAQLRDGDDPATSADVVVVDRPAGTRLAWRPSAARGTPASPT